MFREPTWRSKKIAKGVGKKELPYGWEIFRLGENRGGGKNRTSPGTRK